MSRPYRFQPSYPAHLTQAGEHFASGVNSPGEVRGLFLSGCDLGITASEVREALLAELELFAGGASKVFVDSGAFSEVKFGPAGRTVVKPITEADWAKRFEIFYRVAAAFRSYAYLVAPDCVGDQAVTLERLERYAADVQVSASVGAQIIVPVQKGALPMSQFFTRAKALLGLDVIAGVPMKKDATSLTDLAELVASMPWYGCRIHLLGLGPESKRFAPVVELIKSIRPNCAITSDSVTIRRLVGRTNGRGGGPRALTAAQDRARAAGVTGHEIKAAALMEIGHAKMRTEAQEARRLGWFDEELESAPGVPFLNDDGSPCLEYGTGGPFGDEPAKAEQLDLLGAA